MRRKILCYGDSNTYGYDPRAFPDDRLPETVRWTGILNAMPEWEILNFGRNGREIPHTEAAFAELDAILRRAGKPDGFAVMLGTNDLFCMYEPTAERITERMARFLERLQARPVLGNRVKTLLIAPPPAELGPDGEARRLSRLSAELGAHYRALAERCGVCFADAGEWGVPMAFDGVHISEDGHRLFARRMAEVLSATFPAES